MVGRALETAYASGVLAFAAAGNDGEQRVAFPARHPHCLSVAACGHKLGLPPQAHDEWTVSAHRSSLDTEVFFGRFSNKGVAGTEVDLIAPGAGIVSTVPGDRYAPMSGTSMACPAAVGAAACILAAHPETLTAEPAAERAERFKSLVLSEAQPAGFSDDLEGRGMIGSSL